jgi:hypothetical protein
MGKAHYCLGWLAGDPFQSPDCQKAQQQQVVPTKAGGILPLLALLVAALEGTVIDDPSS